MPSYTDEHKWSGPFAMGEIGLKIFQYYGLDPETTVVEFERNTPKGPLFVLQDATRRVSVLGVDGAGGRGVLLDLSGDAVAAQAVAALSAAQLARLRKALGVHDGPVPVPGAILSVQALESPYAKPAPIKYLIPDMVPEEAITYLCGAGDAGKTTWACAMARDLVRKGHRALLLDRDHNPRPVIRDRLQRLHVTDDDLLKFKLWDAHQPQGPAPLPDDPSITAWVKEAMAETGLCPLVIVDSLVSCLEPGESENDAQAVRKVFNRLRALTDLDAAPILIHHPNRSGDPRGSLDFQFAGDAGFMVTNEPSEKGSRLLHRIVFKASRTRILVNDATFEYADGAMIRAGNVVGAPMGRPRGPLPWPIPAKLSELVFEHPGAGTNKLLELRGEVSEKRVRLFLQIGQKAGILKREGSQNKGYHFYLANEAFRDGTWWWY
jgi:hypothetical protein